MTPTDTGGGRLAATAAGEPLAIFAGSGSLPVQVATAAVAAGRNLLILAVEDGGFDERLRSFHLETIRWGQIGRLAKLLTDHGTREIVLVGTVAKRPDFSSIRLDFGALRVLPRLMKAIAGGDNTALGQVSSLLADIGVEVIGAHEIVPDLVAKAGHVAGPKMPGGLATDVTVALAAARAVGALDIGQSVIAANRRVIAVEAAEGTDAMIERVGGLHESGRIKWSGRAGVLVKCAKPNQNLALDMPAIGPRTIEAVARAGLAGIVIEAGRVMIAERPEAIAAAERTGTFLVAVDGP